MMSQLAFVDAFTDTPGCGNRAGIVLDASGLSAAAMQRIAAQAGASETAFGLPSPEPARYDLEVRYFSRTREVPICGHATIAFHYLRAWRLGLATQTLRVKTGAGILPVEIVRRGDDVRVTMIQAPPQIIATPDEQQCAAALAALGLDQHDLVPGLPIQVVSTGHAKVLIPIRSSARLHGLRPDRAAVLRLSPFAGANGFFIFTLDRQRDDVLYHGRMFAPATGVDEDPVTGNANGPAGFYLYTHGQLGVAADGWIRYQALQGEAMGRPGLVDVALRVDGRTIPEVRISGKAAIVSPEPQATA